VGRARSGDPEGVEPAAIVERLREELPGADLSILEPAAEAAGNLGQERRARAAALAEVAARISLDPMTAAAALAVGAGVVDPVKARAMAGAEVALLVESFGGLSKLERVRDPEAQARYLRPMLVSMAGDVRVVVLKLAEVCLRLREAVRGRNSSRMAGLARQALVLHAPLAHRLGVAWLKSELEDLGFAVLESKKHADLRQKLDRTRRERDQKMEEVRRDLLRALAGHQPPLKGHVYGRLKHLFSIQRKLEAQKIHFEQVMDIVAFRILLDTKDQCYAALGVIHGMWVPVLGRFKDWIAMPKANGYRSLHTTVLHPKSGRIEIQIRTNEMHRIAEEGLAAHWRYKEGKSGGNGPSPAGRDVEGLPWLSRLVSEMDEAAAAGPQEAVAAVENGLLPEVVYVFTPQGDLRELPADSTPVDFAYSIHSEVGGHCVGAKIDGRIVKLNYVLQNGDQVEIQTHKHQKPREDWLNFVRTPRARQKIRQHISSERRSRAREVGQEAIDKALRGTGHTLARLLKKGEAAAALEATRYRSLDELILAVGYGKITAEQAVKLLLPDESAAVADPARSAEEAAVREGRKPGLKLGGLDDLLVRYARCCNPAAGDDVVGFITRGRGVTVHRSDCKRLADLEPARRIDVYWDMGKSRKRQATIAIRSHNRIGMLANVSKVFQEAGIDIISSSSRVAVNQRADLSFTVSAPNAVVLNGALKKIRRIGGVISASRK